MTAGDAHQRPSLRGGGRPADERGLVLGQVIHTTSKEAAHWTQFWADHGLSQTEVAYARGLGDGTLNAVEEILSHPKVRVVGVVIDKVDKIMHWMEIGTPGMHNQVLRETAQIPCSSQIMGGRSAAHADGSQAPVAPRNRGFFYQECGFSV